jgi:hypothetical protein
MNKCERELILTAYKNCYHVQEITGIDKQDTIRELKHLIDSLNLKRERYQTENEVITERDNIRLIPREMYSLIFDSFAKHGHLVHYDLQEIELIFAELQYEMTDEEVMYTKRRIANIRG